MIQSGPGGVVVKLLQVCFLFVNPRKILHSKNFLLNLDPYKQYQKNRRILQTRTSFKHIFVKKLSNCTVFDERKRQNSKDKGKTYKAKFHHRTRIVLARHRRSGVNQLFPQVSLGSRKTKAILFCSGGSRPPDKGGPGHPDPEIKWEGGSLKKFFFRPFGPRLV